MRRCSTYQNAPVVTKDSIISKYTQKKWFYVILNYFACSSGGARCFHRLAAKHKRYIFSTRSSTHRSTTRSTTSLLPYFTFTYIFIKFPALISAPFVIDISYSFFWLLLAPSAQMHTLKILSNSYGFIDNESTVYLRRWQQYVLCSAKKWLVFRS